MIQGKDGTSIVVSMRFSPHVNRVMRELAGRPRMLGRLVSELVMAEAARRQEREDAAKAKAKKEEE